MEGGDSCRLQVVSCRLWCGEGGPGFFDDGRWSAGVWALGEFGGGEEFGVATGTVARAEEVEETLFADGNGCEGGWGLIGRWGCTLLVVRCSFHGDGGLGGGCGARLDCGWLVLDRERLGYGRGLGFCGACGLEGLEGDLEAVDNLAGAAGVDGVLGEAVDDGGEGDEDAGADRDC